MNRVYGVDTEYMIIQSQMPFLLYYQRISLSGLSLVSISRTQLRMVDPMHQAVKKMNNGAGFQSGRPSVRMGKRMITTEAMIQFAAVEQGTMRGCTISGMQSHTTGPKERPKTAMNRNRPTMIRGVLRLLSSGRKKPMVMMPVAKPSKKAPRVSRVFLPNLLSRQPVKKVVRTWSRLMREGISRDSQPLVALTAILLPQTTMALMPENCCMTAR